MINIYQCLHYFILFDEVDRGPGHVKKIFFLAYHLNGINISLFLKNCYQCLKACVQKKIFSPNDSPSKTMKVVFYFI